MTRRRIWVGCLLLFGGICASLVFADPGVVKTKSGNTLVGEVKQEDQRVIVNIHGVDTVIPRSDVESVEMMGTASADLLQRLAKLDAKDSAGRVALARVAFDRRQYELSRQFLEEAIQIDPNNAEAISLLDIVNSQIRLERTKNEPANPAPAPMPPRTPLGGQAAIERRLLTPADIESIRRHELNPNDTIVRIRFDGDVKKRFADSQNMAYADFTAKSAVEQAIEILNKGDDSMRDKIHVQNDPQAIREYRTQIQPLVLQNCALSGCHGGPPGASLVLFTPAENDALAYTNFYILHGYQRKLDDDSGVFGSGLKRMIDRSHPDRSLLTDYGLPTNVAVFDHPLVNGRTISPVFRNKDDAKYKQVLDWIGNALVTPDPDYGVRYTPPMATTQASTSSTTRPTAPAPAPAP